MAIFDTERGAIVVRIAYDGALAGRASTLQALARGFGRPGFSAGGARGRKRPVDWIDFVEGRFDGSSIRCQLVSVPAPAASARRRALLDTADTVVLVVDPAYRATAATRRAIASLEEVVAGKSPPVGVIFQIHLEAGSAGSDGSDGPGGSTGTGLPGAPDGSVAGARAALEELGATLGGSAITETHAATGEGVAETFALAVRLALDRVRELDRTGALPHHPAAKASASNEDLLTLLRHAEGRFERSGAARGEHPPERRDGAGDAPLEPTLPRADVAGGNVWPPVEGRVVLHAAERGRPGLQRSRRGDWAAEHGPWRWHSALADLYDDPFEGRDALLDWASAHAAIAWFLSPRRAIALAPAAPGAWRLWQVALQPASLEQRLRETLRKGDARALASQLVAASAALVSADRQMVAPGLLHRVALSTLAEVDGRVVYSGLLSPQSAPPPEPRPPADAEALLRHEIEPILAETGARERPDLPRIVDWLAAAGAACGPAAQSDILIAMLSGR